METALVVPSARAAHRRIGRAALVGLVVVAAAVCVVGALAFAGWQWERANAKEHELLFVVPKGTAVLQAMGKGDMMLPKTLILPIGEHDTLVIRNEDDFPIRVGPFKLEAGQTYRQRFRNVGKFQLVCSTMYHEEQVNISVVESRKWERRLTSALFR